MNSKLVEQKECMNYSINLIQNHHTGLGCWKCMTIDNENFPFSSIICVKFIVTKQKRKKKLCQSRQVFMSSTTWHHQFVGISTMYPQSKLHHHPTLNKACYFFRNTFQFMAQVWYGDSRTWAGLGVLHWVQLISL